MHTVKILKQVLYHIDSCRHNLIFPEKSNDDWPENRLTGLWGEIQDCKLQRTDNLLILHVGCSESWGKINFAIRIYRKNSECYKQRNSLKWRFSLISICTGKPLGVTSILFKKNNRYRHLSFQYCIEICRAASCILPCVKKRRKMENPNNTLSKTHSTKQ